MRSAWGLSPAPILALALACSCTTTTAASVGDAAPPFAPAATPATGAARDETRADGRGDAHGDGAPAGDPEISAEAYRAVLEAEIKLQAGDVPGGIQMLREAVLHDPASPYLRVRLAEAYLEAGDAEQARASAQDALAIKRSYVPAWRIVGAAWSVAGDRKAARRAYDEALKASPGDRDASMLLAELLVEDSDVDEAEHVVERLMQKEEGAVDGYIALARVFAERGDVERAFKHVKRALDRESGDTAALELKLTLLWGLGRFDEALPVAKILAASAGDGPDVRRDLLSAEVLARATDDADALAQAWLDDDSSETMRLLVADAFERAGEPRRAMAALGARSSSSATTSSPRVAAEIARLRLLVHDPAGAANAVCPLVDKAGTLSAADVRVSAFATATCARAWLHVSKAKEAGALLQKKLGPLGGETVYLEALAAAAKAGGIDNHTVLVGADAALQAKPAEAEVVIAVARVHEELGDVDRARAILDQALRAKPSDAELLFALARHLERQKQPLPGVEIVERLLDRGKKDVDELNFVAFTLAEAGVRADDARRFAWRALVQDPLNGYVVDTLGWCQLMAGDVDGAVATLQRADRLSPDESEVLFHLATALDRKGDKRAALDAAARAKALIEDDDPVKSRVEALMDKLKKAGA